MSSNLIKTLPESCYFLYPRRLGSIRPDKSSRWSDSIITTDGETRLGVIDVVQNYWTYIYIHKQRTRQDQQRSEFFHENVGEIWREWCEWENKNIFYLVKCPELDGKSLPDLSVNIANLNNGGDSEENEGNFSPMRTLTSFYTVVGIMFIFNVIFNERRNFCSLKYDSYINCVFSTCSYQLLQWHTQVW